MRRFTLPLVFVSACLCALLAMLPAQAGGKGGRQLALLVACSDYDTNELNKVPYSVKEMSEFKDVLLASGCTAETVVFLHDNAGAKLVPIRDNIEKQLRLLINRAEIDDTVIVALNGHGVQFKGDKTAYFCPINAVVAKKDTLVAMEEVFAQLKACRAKKVLLIVNACRNDPRSKQALAAPGQRVELVDRDEQAPAGIVAIYSCQKSEMSFFYPEDKKLYRSLFMHHLLEAWQGKYTTDGEVTLDEVFRQVRRRTVDEAATYGWQQKPEINRELKGEWIIAQAALPKELVVDLGGGVKMKLVCIPPGKFQMGSPKDEEGRFDDEGPQHEVTLTKAFYLGKFEVTRGQFRKFVEAKDYRTDAEKDGKGAWAYDAASKMIEQRPEYTWRNPGFAQTDDHPVVSVSWNDAKAFCAWLSAKEGKTYRLPTEAEWEYAARAATKTRYHTGDTDASVEGYANVADAKAKKVFPNWATFAFDDGYTFTAPVGQFKANGFGLHDMIGNASEWCEDGYDGRAYQRGACKDPFVAEGARRVRRGGSWLGPPRECRSANRPRVEPAYRSNRIGFRLALQSVR
jgi:formylglycine-generating enzyme required for sulfatase activity